eukprot:CAMPEP_0113943792 /NCGR_PEP_ID=MMETSP1339-20121228/27927_1 /TAXON_ID=94617 /ORGANISM="Fibrocapsa japonica" /LENGTH=225 /DNA_ID=CAMNT_0000948749 /DNA_START=97 /DNA_END=774 /DNA_ORIENTATION=+ /assembly_acc=CAM_ASM_000762
MVVRIGDEMPDFMVDTQVGRIQLHTYFGGSWGVLFSHPADYTPVCTTELGTVAKLSQEWAKRDVKVIGLSCDTVEEHNGWIKDIKAATGQSVEFPMIADANRSVSQALDMLDQTHINASGMPLTVRSVFIVGPDKKIKLILTYPASTGRNFDEIIRVIDSLQLTANQKLATPADWKRGGDCVILPSVPDSEASGTFKGFTTTDLPSKKSYLRYTNDPMAPKCICM